MSNNDNINSGSDAKGNIGGMEDWPVISSYSRAQFIEDGGLVEVPRAVGARYFNYPIGITREVWEGCVADLDAPHGERDNARLQALLCDAVHVARRGEGQSLMDWNFNCIPPSATGTTTQDFHLMLHIGPGDTAAPVLTIMFPSQA